MHITKPVIVFLLIVGVLPASTASSQGYHLIDANATKETKALYKNLRKLSKKHSLFGHQHATQYGHGWSGDEDRSDVKSIVGSHPAVIGVDFSGFTGGSPESIKRAKEDVRKTIINTYNRGGVTTVAWHFPNPLSKGGFNWVDSISVPSVKYLIPGGKSNDLYKEILKGIAEFVLGVKGADGKLVPMLFRPYHEFDGGWFWWGKPHCTREEFMSLWKFTVSYLRDTMNVHNFIYIFSPDNRFFTQEQYLERYPGDEWVDMVGVDNYGDMGRDRYDIETAAKKLKIVSDYALKAGKLAAFTETGLETIPNPAWWTNTLLKVMKLYDMHLAYVLVWRNDIRSLTHFYAPFPGQVSLTDFKKFYDDPYTLFENDLKSIYRQKKFLGIF